MPRGPGLAKAHPGHWVTLVWVLSCWQVGAVVTLEQPGATVAVLGPDDAAEAARAETVLVCSLHPLGLPLAGPPPAGVLDYALEVRTSPTSTRPCPSPGWPWPGGTGTGSSPRPTWSRRADRAAAGWSGPTDPWPTARTALVEPLLGGGSTVLVAGPVDAERLADIAAQERVDVPG